MITEEQYERLLRKGRAIGYHWHQTKDGQIKIEDSLLALQKQHAINEGLLEGRELAIWEHTKNNYMEDEKVDQQYKDLFNLGYTLSSSRGPEYEVAMKIMETSNPNFKHSEQFKAMEAGKNQEESERTAWEQEHITNEDINNEKSTDMPPPPLNDEQKKEVDAHEKWLKEREEARKFNEATVRIQKQTGINLNPYEPPPPQSFGQHPEPPKSFKDKFLEKIQRNKDKGHDHEH